MIRGGKLLLETPDSRQTSFQNDQRGNLILGTPPDSTKTNFNMIKGGAGVGGVNDLIHCSEGDLSTCFLPFVCDVKAASFILATLTSLEQ